MSNKRANAKFRVGQVVGVKGSSDVGKIHRVMFLSKETPEEVGDWCYWLSIGAGFFPQSYLRPLTKRERGERHG